MPREGVSGGEAVHSTDPTEVPSLSFNRVQYVILLVAVVVVHRRLGVRGQNWLVLVASYVFYGAWDWRFLSLLAVSTLVDFSVARGIRASDDARRRLLLLRVSLATNLGILGMFKYFGFFAESFEALAGRLGMGVSWPTLAIVLPVGISFYTFQTLSYTIDVYRGKVAATDDLLAFAVYVAFFPQLVAGPIERAGRLLPQFMARRPPAPSDRVWSGVHLIALGLVKKVAIADAVAPLVDAAFSEAGSASGFTLALGVVGFGIQIYGDFSGYSDIARGSARLLGVELMRNFEQPYLSTSITEFWRRWHISLSTWLRDYLYIPLGGNRGTAGRTSRNLMVTMLLGGLWHGAAWTFVVWGGLHGLYLLVHRRVGRGPVERSGLPRWGEVPAVAVTWLVVHVAWVFFRADGFGQAVDVLSGIVTWRAGAVDRTALVMVPVALAATLFIDVAQRVDGRHSAIAHWRPVARGVAYGVGAAAFLVFAGQAPVPFIYFQF